MISPSLTDHPMIPLPKSSVDRARLVSAMGGAEEVNGWLKRRAERIAQADQDPLRYGWETESVPRPDGTAEEFFPHWRILRQLWAGTFTHEGETFPPARDILLLGGKRASKRKRGQQRRPKRHRSPRRCGACCRRPAHHILRYREGANGGYRENTRRP